MTRLAAGIVVTLFACVHGQPTAATPNEVKREFETVSIKYAPPPDAKIVLVNMRGGPGSTDPTHLVLENVNLFQLVLYAYGVKPYQLFGVEASDSVTFNIKTQVPVGATTADVRMMMQNLLADRFKLTLHHAPKEVPVYELVIARYGPKLTESVEVPPDASPANRGGVSVTTSLPKDGTAHVRFSAPRYSMREFVVTLSGLIGQPVDDATGLKRSYDIVLTWVPEAKVFLAPLPSLPGSAAPLIEAIREQLGLDLVSSKKAPVDALVIDHYEASLEN